MSANPVVLGLTSSGELLIQGIVEAQGISSETIHHVGSKSQFEAETWSGEHEEHQHQEDRRYSLVHDNESTKGHDEDTPIASSEHFERKRTPSLAAALLEVDPQGVPLIHFFHPANDTPLLEAEEDAAVEVEEAGESEKIISSLLFLLREMKMKEPEKYTIAVQRLRELEAELRAAGAVTPADPAVSDAVARALAASGPGRDVQIRVNQSRHTTTTKTVYETETPGMAGLDPEKIRELHQQMLASITSGQTDSSADSGTTQKKETAEEGFTNEDGSVVVSKKMTRVVTTTKTTLPGEGEAPAPDSPTESLGSVKDRIAKFESLKEGDQASIASSASEEREPTTARSERSYLEHAQVDIVVTPGSPVPPDLDEEDEVAEAQEPLSPSVEEVSQAEVKSVGSYEEEQEEQEPLSPESDRSSTADILSNEPDSARRQKKREILEQSTTTTYDFSTSKEDRRRLQQGAEGEQPEEYLGEHEEEYHKETALESPTEEMPHYRAEAVEAPDTHKSHERRETTEHTTTTTYDFTTTKEDRKHLEHGDEGELSEEQLGAYEQEQLKEKAVESPVEEPPYHRTEVTGAEYGRKEPESPSAAEKLKDFAKGAGKVAAGVVAAPIALAAIGAAAAYDKLKGDKDERDEEAVKESPDEATRYEEPYTPTEEAASEVRPVEEIPRTPSPPAVPEVSSPARSETEGVPEEEEPATTATVTKEYEFTPEHEEAEHVQGEEKPQHFTETTTIVTESFYDEPSPSDRGSLGEEEEEHKPHHVVETTTITKEYDVGSEESPVKEEFLREAPFEPEAETEEHALRHVVETTTIRREYDEEEPATGEQETVAAPIDDANIPQHVTEAKKQLESPEGGRHTVETTTITTEQTYYDEPETKDELLSPESEQELPHVARDEETPEPTSPEDHHVHKVIEKTTITKEVFEAPEVSEERITSISGQEPERLSEEGKHIVEQTTVITGTSYFEEPQKHSPVEEQPPVPQKRASIAEHHEEEALKESPKEQDEPYEPIGEESDEERGVGDKLKGLAKGVGKVIAAPVALAAVGAAAAYEKLRRGSEEEEEEEEALAEKVAEKSPIGEEAPTPAKRTTAEEPIATSSPIEPEARDIFEEEHEEPVEVETTTVTREYYEEPEISGPSTVAGEEDHEKPHHVVGVTTITTDYYEEPAEEELPISEEQKQPGEQEEPGRHVVETTTITREYDVGPEDHATEEPESFEGLIDDFHMPSHLIEAARGETHTVEGEEPVSQEEELAEKPSHIVETTTTVRESFEVPESPAESAKEEEPEHHERHVIETTTITKETYYDEPTEEERLFEEPTPKAEEHHERPSIVETTTITREYDEELGGEEIGFERPEDLETPDERKENIHHLEEEGVGTPALPSELPSPPPSPAEKVETEEAEEEHVKQESYYFEPETAEKREEEPALHEPVSYSEAEEHLQEPVETPKLDEETKEDVHYREEHPEPDEERPTTRESHPHQDHQHLEGVHREGAIRRHSHDEDQPEEPKEHLDEYQHVYHEEEHLPHEVGARPVESEGEHYPVEEQEEGESTKDKLLGFAKGVGKVAVGVVAAPVALAAVGAVAAYDKLKGDKDEEEEKTREEYMIKESSVREEERQQESQYVYESEKSEQEGLPETTSPVREEFRIEVEEPKELSHDVEPAELSDKLKEEQEEQEHREEQRPEHPSSLHVQEVPQVPSDLASPSDEENRLPVPIAPTDLPSNVETPDSEKAPAEEEESQHIVETTIVTKETFDEPETASLDEPHMHHVVETTTIRRDVYYDEPTDEREMEPHIVETTTTTHEASYDEPTSPKRSGEESPAEGEHTIETTITTRQVMPEEPLSPKEHHHEPHVLETSTTVKDTFYDEEESTTAEPYLEDIEEKEEEHLEEGEHPRFVETTTTTRDITFHETPAETEEEGEIPHHDNNREVEIYTKTEYHDEPTGLEDMGEAQEEHHRRTETTTTVKEIFYDKHSSRESPVPSDEEFDVEKALKHKPVEDSHEEPIHVTETTTTVRDYYDEPSPVEESPSREEEVPHHLHETITTERDFFEEPEKSEHAAPEHHEPLHVVETTVTTKDSYPEETSPALKEKHYHEEEPVHKPVERTEEHHYPPQEEEGDEGESTKDKLLGFAKGVGKVAAGVVAAPIALAAVGAVAAYDKLKGDDEDEDKMREEYLVKESPIRGEHRFEEPTEREHHVTESRGFEEHHDTTLPVKEEQHFEEAELHRKEEPEYVIESREAQFEERQELASPTRSPSPPGKESQQHSDFLVEEEHHFEEEPKEIVYGLESPSASEKEPEHVIESRETLFEERPELASPTASEREEFEETPHHIVETKITTTETYYDEEDQPHVKETTTTRRDLVEEIDRSGQESPVDRVVQSTTVTTERVLEPEELLAEEHTHEPELTHERHIIESTEDIRQPLEEPSSPVVAKREQWEEVEERTPFEEKAESGNKDEEDLHRVVETFTTQREYYPEEALGDEQELHGTRIVETVSSTKESFYDEPSPTEETKEEQGGEDEESHLHHVRETTTVTTETFYEEPEEGEQEKGTDETGSNASVIEQEVDRPSHAVETTTTVKETYFDEPSPVESEKESVQEHAESQEQLEPHHIVETTTVTKETYYDEPIAEEPHHIVESTTTVRKTTFEEADSPHASQEALFHGETPGHEETVPVVTEKTITKREVFYDEPEVEELPPAEHVIESEPYATEAQYEEPTSPVVKEKQFEEAEDYQQGLESADESDDEATSPTKKKKGLGSKIMGFAKKAGVAAVAPVALAAKGASTAYDALKHKDKEPKEIQGEEVMHDKEERVYTFKGQESESEESPLGSPETARKTEGAREEEMEHVIPSEEYEIPTQTHVPLDVMESRVVEEEQHVIESETYEDLSQVPAATIKVDTVADEEEEEDIPAEEKESHVIESTDFHPSHYEEQIRIDSRAEQPEEEEEHVIESTSYEEEGTVEAVHEPEEYRTSPLMRRDVLEKDEDEQLRTTEYYKEEEKEDQDRASTPASSDSRIIHDVAEETHSDRPLDEETGEPVRTTEEEHIHYERPEHLTERESHPEQDHRHLEGVHREGAIRRHSHDEGQPQKLEEGTEDHFHHTEEHLHQETSPKHLETSYEEEIHEQRTEDVGKAPTHEAHEYLTTPVVSGYTASGEPINTGIVISAPPSPAKQMPTHEAYHEEEKEHETVGYVGEEQAHRAEEHLSHETTPRHFETGYEEEHYPVEEEEEGESTKDKLLGFAKGVGKVAAGVVAAPIALAAVGAVAAYDKLKGDDEEEEKTREEYLVKESPIKEEHQIEEPTERGHHVTESREFEEHHDATSPVKEEQHFEAELHREEEPEHVIESRETQFEERQELASPARSPSQAAKDAEEHPEEEEHHFEEADIHREEGLKHVIDSGETHFEDRQELESPGRSPSPAHREFEEHREQSPKDLEETREEHPEIGSPEKDERYLVEEPKESSHGSPVSEKEPEHVIESREATFDDRAEISSPTGSEKLTQEEHLEEKPHHIVETTVTTTETYYDEEDQPHVSETTTTTRELVEDEPVSEVRSGEESPVDRVIETTTITTERVYEPEELITEEQDHPHLHEITTTTTTREIYGSPEEEQKAPLGEESILGEEEHLHEETTEKPHVIETTTTTTETHYEPEEQRTDLEGESPAREKPFEEGLEEATQGKEPIYETEEDLNEPRQVVETTTITRESHFYEEPAELSPVAEEGKEFYSEQETEYAPQHPTETTTMTTTTTYHEESLETPSSEQESGYEHGKTGEDLGEREEPLHYEEEVHREPISKEESHQVVEPSPTLPSESEFVEEMKDISGEPIHVEDEYLTAPVVSGYTASGEPINTGIVISAPPSPAKQMPTEEAYHDEEKELETPVQHHAEYDEPEQKEEQPHVEEHLSHEPTPRHFETGYEEEHYPVEEEEEGESTKDKLLGFAKGVGKVAAGVVAAPIALAAVGAVAAYDKLKGDEEEEEKTREEYLVKESPIREEHHFEEPAERGHHVTESREFEEHHDATSPVKEEQHFEAELHREEEPEHVIESRETQFEERHELASPARSPSPATKEAEGHHEDTLVKPSSPATIDVHYEELPSEDRGFTQEERRPSHDQREYKPEEETLEERLSPESKMEISHFVTDVVEEATAGAVIEAAEDLTPRSQRGDHLHELEELALENVNRMRFEEEPDHLQSPEKQSEESPSSDRDESRLIAGDDEWKVYDSTGQVVEEFSAQLTDQAIEDAGADVIQAISPATASPASARRLIAQESMNEVAMEPEVDYQSDLQEKLDILAGQKSEMLPMVREEELDVIHESEGESEEPDPINETAARLVDEVIETVLEEHDGGKTSSDYFYTATEKSKDDQYDTCVTSQEDTFETAQGWTSQDSEYTTATSEAPSRLSELEERTEGTTTPQAALSPVDSDRQFVVDLDKEPRPVLSSIRSFTLDDETARSTPDVALQITIEEEDEPDEGMVTSPSGVLLAPHMDPGRPVSPVPPRKQQTPDDEEGAFVFVARDHSKELGTEESVDVPETPSTSEVSDESARYTRHSSDVSEVSHADTVIHKEQERDDQSVIDEQLPSTFVSHGGSADSLDKASVKSTGRRSSGSSIKAPEEPAEPEEKESPKSQDLSPDQTNLSPHLESPHIEHQELETEEGFVMYQREGDEQGELETVEEEPEDADSLNGGSGNSSVGAPASLAKYKHVSSDNVSLTSLQEFERLEQLVASKGDSSLTASEIELYTAGRPRSMEGSMSSLAEFERLEQEMTHQANQSPQDEMMLSVVKEESEAEDMSIRDDDEDEAFSETEIKSRPVNEEEMRAGTPQALSPSDSLERDVISNIAILETSTDSLEPSFQQKPQSDIMADSLTEYEVVPRMDSTRDSLENIPMDKDSLLEVSSQDQTSQETHGLLSGDTVGTYQEHDDDDKDSLGGEMESMLRSYPTTLTTFETTTVAPDGSIQTISRRVETRVVDPVMSHVEFTGTESQERLNQLPLEQPIDTVDAQGNVTRTLFKRQPPHSE